MARNKFLTPNELGDPICRPVWLPGDSESIAVLRGQILELTKVYNWQECGAVTPAEAAAAWTDVLWMFDQKKECGMPTGTMVAYAGAVIPDGWILCDGTQYTQVEYPALFDAILDHYGGNIGLGVFNVPDMREKFLHGAKSSSTLGDTGGAAEVTLTCDEMPEHDHDFTLVYTAVPVGELVPVAIVRPNAGTPVTKTTATEGGDGSHENMPPYNTASWMIKT